MDLRQYYQKIREVRGTIDEEFPVVVSVETPDGGKAGSMAEVTKDVAARMIVDNRARLATAAESAMYREEKAEAKRMADEAAAATRMQVTVLSESELRNLRGPRQRDK